MPGYNVLHDIITKYTQIQYIMKYTKYIYLVIMSYMAENNY